LPACEKALKDGSYAADFIDGFMGDMDGCRIVGHRKFPSKSLPENQLGCFPLFLRKV
jgi:hypothetical protein